MPTKPGLTRQEHEELGMRLKQLRDDVLHISRQLDTAYAKMSPCARLSYRAAQTLDKLRSALDRQAFLDYCQWDTQEKVQFKGARMYYPGNDARTDNYTARTRKARHVAESPFFLQGIPYHIYDWVK